MYKYDNSSRIFLIFFSIVWNAIVIFAACMMIAEGAYEALIFLSIFLIVGIALFISAFKKPKQKPIPSEYDYHFESTNPTNSVNQSPDGIDRSDFQKYEPSPEVKATSDNHLNVLRTTTKFAGFMGIIIGVISLIVFAVNFSKEETIDLTPLIVAVIFIISGIISFIRVKKITPNNNNSSYSYQNRSNYSYSNPNQNPIDKEFDDDQYFVKYCEYCGESLSKKDQFCPSCGKPVSKK